MTAGIALLAVLLCEFVSGCTMGPDYKHPQDEVAQEWSGPTNEAMRGPVSVPVTRDFDGRRWWTVFKDPLLDSLVQQAQGQNIDLQVATLRIASARARRDAAAGPGYPSVAGTGVAGRTRMSENGIAGALGGGSSGTSPGAAQDSSSSPSLTTNLFQAGFDATWELDLWGRVRRGVEAAQADVISAEESRNDALASLTAEIGRDYLALRGTQRQLAIVQADLATQERLGQLARSRLQAGLGSQADVDAQDAQIHAVQSQIPPLSQNVIQGKNRLALLLALPPGALDQLLHDAKPASVLPPEVPIGMPGELLMRRPDVRRTDADLHAAMARVGVAKARLFPSITLGLAAGLQSTTASQLGDWGSRFFLGGAEVSIPIFQGGQLKAQVKLADIDAQQAALTYRQTVLNAVHDAEQALIAYGQEQRRSAALQAQVDSAQRSRELAVSRWHDGLAAFVEVLDSERTAHQSQLSLVQSTSAASTDLVAVFKALGGGWQE